MRLSRSFVLGPWEYDHFLRRLWIKSYQKKTPVATRATGRVFNFGLCVPRMHITRCLKLRGRPYPNVSTAHVTRPYGRVTWDVNLFACPEINFNFIYALDITYGTLYG